TPVPPTPAGAGRRHPSPPWPGRWPAAVRWSRSSAAAPTTRRRPPRSARTCPCRRWTWSAASPSAPCWACSNAAGCWSATTPAPATSPRPSARRPSGSTGAATSSTPARSPAGGTRSACPSGPSAPSAARTRAPTAVARTTRRSSPTYRSTRSPPPPSTSTPPADATGARAADEPSVRTGHRWRPSLVDVGSANRDVRRHRADLDLVGPPLDRRSGGAVDVSRRDGEVRDPERDPDHLRLSGPEARAGEPGQSLRRHDHRTDRLVHVDRHDLGSGPATGVRHRERRGDGAVASDGRGGGQAAGLEGRVRQAEPERELRVVAVPLARAGVR